MKILLFSDIPPWVGSFVEVNTFDAIAGTTVKAITKLANKEYPIVSPISTNNYLVIPSVNTIGKNTQTVVKVDAAIAPATSLLPSTAASFME